MSITPDWVKAFFAPVTSVPNPESLSRKVLAYVYPVTPFTAAWPLSHMYMPSSSETETSLSP